MAKTRAQAATGKAPQQDYEQGGAALDLDMFSGGALGSDQLAMLSGMGNAALQGMFGAGDPLPSGMQGELSEAAGAPVGDVRVHTGPEADAVLQSGQQAVTIGQHVFMRQSEANDTSTEGRLRWAHEIAHTFHESGSGQGGSSAGLEAEAEGFGAAFATGAAQGHGLTQGARGPSPMAADGDQCSPSVEELAAPVRNRLREIRGQGTDALVAEVRRLRGQASGDALTAINLAVEQVLTDQEKAALEGRELSEDEQGQTTGGSTQMEAIPEAPEGTTGNEEAEECVDEQGEGEETGGQEGGEQTEGQEGGEQGGGGGGGEGGGAQGAVTTEQALQPVTPLPESDRGMVESELAFHERWQAMSGGAGSRAMQLASGLGDDLIKGGTSAAWNVGITQASTLLTRIPVPGLGNIIGGAFSAYNLFSNGGAGIASMAGNIGEAFSWEGKGPWQIMADVVQGIKSLMDLIGNICNILSGLAYAFAAIAALGGLLSIFFPPLAFLVPYIPTAINFGRACGGIAGVTLGISGLISPIPPVLRAIHILVSDQDPLALMQQEDQFHGEMQTFIGSYGAAAVNQGIKTGGGSFNPIANQTSSISSSASATSRAVGDMRNGNVAARDAIQFQGQGQGSRTGGNGQANGRNYFNMRGNVSRQTGMQEQKQGQSDNQRAAGDRHMERANELRPDNPNAPRNQRRPAMVQENNANRHYGRADQLQSQADEHGYRASVAQGTQGSSLQGKVGSGSYKAIGKPLIFGSSGEDGPEAQPVQIERDQNGHVVLPSPPGGLSEVDGLDAQIAQLQQDLAGQQQVTNQAGEVESQATTQVSTLGMVEEGLQCKMDEHSALESEQATVQAQQAQVQTDTATQADQNEGGMSQAAEVLRPWVGPAQTVNGVIQQVPSNRFFDVSGTQRNMQEFVTGMEQLTGQGDEASETRAQTDTVLAQRDEQITQAQTTHEQVTSQGSEAQTQVQTDRSEATSVASEAGALRQQSSQTEMTLEQQIETKRQERESKWGALLGWAQNHYSVRSAAQGQ